MSLRLSHLRVPEQGTTDLLVPAVLAVGLEAPNSAVRSGL